MAYSVRVGAWGFGTSSHVAAVPTGNSAPVSGDAMYIFTQSQDGSTTAGTPNIPAGWTRLFEETQGSGGTGVTTLTIFGKMAGVGEVDVTVTGVGNNCCGYLVVVGGHTLSTIANTIVGTGNGNALGKTSGASINAVACSANSVVIAAATYSADYKTQMGYDRDQWFNSTLTDFTLLGDRGSSSGLGGGVAMVYGFATGTTTGTTTARMPYDHTWRGVHIAIPATAPSTVFAQPHFRIRSDDSQTLNADAGWAGALDTNATILADAKCRIRFEVEATGTGPATQFKLQFRRNSGIWQPVGVWDFSVSLVEEEPDGMYETNIAPSAQYNTGDATTNVLVGSSQAFSAGSGREDNATGSITLVNQHTEYEWTIRTPIGWGASTDTARVFHGWNSYNDQFEFRIVQELGTPFGGTYVYPKITLSIPDRLIGGTYAESPKNAFYGDLNGNLYQYIEIAECANWPIMLKSSDGGKKWFRQRGGLGEPFDDAISNDLESIDIDVLNGVMHIFSTNGQDLTYHRYHTSAAPNPDTWQITGELILPVQAVPTEQMISGQVRSDGSCVCAYEQNVSAGVDQIVYMIRSAGGGWTTPLPVDDTPANYSDVWLKTGLNDGVHIFYFDHTNFTLLHKILAKDGTLSGRDVVATGLNTSNGRRCPIIGVVFWLDAGTEKIMVGYGRADEKIYTRTYTNGKFGNEQIVFGAPRPAPARRQSAAFWDNNTVNISNQPGLVRYVEPGDSGRSDRVLTRPSGLTPAPEQALSAVNVYANGSSATSGQWFAHLAKDERDDATSTVYALYVDDAGHDIWIDKNVNGAGWGTDALVLTANSTFIRGAIMQHSVANGGKVVYAFNYDESLGFSGKISTNEFVTPGGLTVVTKTHTVDAVIKKNLTRTHTTDADVSKTIKPTHTVDSVISVKPTKTHTTDATILKPQTKTHTVDATIKRTFILFHTMDAVIQPIAGNIRQHTVNAVIKVVQLKTHTTDGIIKKNFIKTHTVDAVISTTVGGTKTHTTDAVIKKLANTRIHTVSAFIVPLLVPTPFTATVISPTRVDLSWGAVTGAVGYDIERNGTIIVFRQAGTTYSDTTVISGVTYTYRVRAIK